MQVNLIYIETYIRYVTLCNDPFDKSLHENLHMQCNIALTPVLNVELTVYTSNLKGTVYEIKQLVQRKPSYLKKNNF